MTFATIKLTYCVYLINTGLNCNRPIMYLAYKNEGPSRGGGNLKSPF